MHLLDISERNHKIIMINMTKELVGKVGNMHGKNGNI